MFHYVGVFVCLFVCMCLGLSVCMPVCVRSFVCVYVCMFVLLCECLCACELVCLGGGRGRGVVFGVVCYVFVCRYVILCVLFYIHPDTWTKIVLPTSRFLDLFKGLFLWARDIVQFWKFKTLLGKVF